MSKYGILPFILTIITAGTAFAYESITTNVGAYTITYTCQNSCIISGGTIRDSGGSPIIIYKTRRFN